ncbi:Oxysterol-binding protein 3, partial [Spiromyces aspiralis]
MTMFEGAIYHIAKDQSPPPLTHRSATAYSTARESAISSPTTQSQTPGDENDVFYDTYEVIEVEKSTSPESGGEYADSDEGRDDDGQFYSATQSPLTTSKSAVSPGIGRLQTSLRLSSLSKEQPIHDEVEDMRRARAKVDEYEESEEDEDEDDTSSVDLEEDLHNDPDFTRAMLSGSFSRLPISSIRTKQSENDETRALPERAPPLCSGSQEGAMAVKVVHRKRLPSPTVPDNSNVLSILRKNLGKDLSAIAMPITTNEPINALQLLCEEMQYAELLNRAGRAADSIDRL